MKTALVLAGGGSRGAYQIGVWQALREMNVSVQIVTGTSVGALNGALIAQDSFETAKEVWKNIETKMVFDFKGEASLSAYAKEFLKKGGATSSGLSELLHTYLDENAVRSSSIEFGLVTVKKKGLEPCELYLDEIPKGQLIDYLLASAACFPAVKSHCIEDTEYIDGGYHDNMPVSLARRKGADRLIVVNLESIGLTPDSPKQLKQEKDTVYISPRHDLGNFLIFEKDTAKRNMRLGYLDTLKAFSFFDGDLYTFAKHDFSTLAKNKSITLKKWKEFFRSVRLKGNLLHLTGYSAMEKVLESNANQLLTTPVTLQTAAETAGKILGIDPLVLYTADSFHQALSQAVSQEMTEKNVDQLWQNYEEKTLSPKAEWLKTLDQKTVTLFFARLFQKNPESIFHVAPLFAKEAIAGFYLMVFDLL